MLHLVPLSSLECEMSDIVDDTTFEKVKRKRKMEKQKEMESDDGELTNQLKRPSFPPVDASTTLVCILENFEYTVS